MGHGNSVDKEKFGRRDDELQDFVNFLSDHPFGPGISTSCVFSSAYGKSTSSKCDLGNSTYSKRDFWKDRSTSGYHNGTSNVRGILRELQSLQKIERKGGMPEISQKNLQLRRTVRTI